MFFMEAQFEGGCRGAQIRRRSLHPPVPGSGRPKPPRGSDAVERRIWNAVVDSLPDRWCDPSAQEVLRQAVAQAAVARRLAQRLRKLRAQNLDSPSDEEYRATGVAHRDASSLGRSIAVSPPTRRLRMGCRLSSSSMTSWAKCEARGRLCSKRWRTRPARCRIR